MGKHLKVNPAPTEQEVGTPDALLRRTALHLQNLLGASERLIAAGEATPAIMRESVAVARALTALAAEVRQQEKHARGLLDSMGPDELLGLLSEYCSTLAPELQQKLIERLSQAQQSIL
jgi:hypothetical protein